ncbi:hypothetical protein Tco_1290168 [Tanacetum coccineum]
MGEGLANPTDSHYTPTIIQPSPQPQKKQKPRKPKRKDTQIPESSGPTEHVADEVVYKELDDSLVRVATSASSLEAEQDSGNIIKTRSKATPNEAGSQGTTLGGGPRRQETIRDTIAQTRFENVSKLSNDSLLARGNTLRSGEDSLKLNELMELCSNLQTRVLDLEKTKTTQANEITSFKRGVKKLEKKDRSRTHKLKRLYKVGLSARVESSKDEEDLGEDASKQGRITDIDANKDIYLVNVQTDEYMFDVNDLDGDEVIIESVDVVNTAKETRSVVEEVTVVTISVSAATTTTTTTAITDVEMTLAQTLAELKSAKPKADKVVIQEPEQGTTTPTLTTITDATTVTAVKVQDKGKGKIVEPKPVKKIYKKELLGLDEELAFKLQAKEEEERLAREKAQQLVQRLQAQEQEELTDAEKARLFVQFLEQRRKHFAAKRAEEKRNKPPTRAQQRSIISKREGDELEQESSKKQKLEEDKESEELKQCLKIILDDGDNVTIDATPLSTKSPTIVDYKIYQEGKKSFFQIIREDGKHQMYLTFGKMLKNFDREELEVLWSIVKARFKTTKPVNYMDNFLLLNLKTMFEHHVEDNVWNNQQGLVKMYPLIKHTLNQMFNDVKLQVDYEYGMAFELLRLVKKQLKEGYIP